MSLAQDIVLETTFAFVVFLLACSPSSASQVESTGDNEFVKGAEIYVYRKSSAPPIRLFVIKPADWKIRDRRSGLVTFFGGGWTTGSPLNSVWTAQWAASLGFVAFAPDYRTASKYGSSPLESVADARLALRWIEQHAAEFGIDPKRIVVTGGSAGAHLALWTAISHCPPGSPTEEAPLFKPAALLLTSGVSDTSNETGYTPQRFAMNARALSPLHQLDPQMPPAFVIHGDDDKSVPFRQSEALVQQLSRTGNRAELVCVRGGGHDFMARLPGWAENTHRLEEVFLRSLGLLKAAPVVAPDIGSPN